MALDLAQLGQSMASAFLGTLKDKVPDIKEYAESEAKKLAQSLVMIEQLLLANKITEDEAKLHLEIQKSAARAVLLAIEGLGVLAVEAAINAALAVVKAAVNTALKFPLIV